MPFLSHNLRFPNEQDLEASVYLEGFCLCLLFFKPFSKKSGTPCLDDGGDKALSQARSFEGSQADLFACSIVQEDWENLKSQEMNLRQASDIRYSILPRITAWRQCQLSLSLLSPSFLCELHAMSTTCSGD